MADERKKPVLDVESKSDAEILDPVADETSPVGDEVVPATVEEEEIATVEVVLDPEYDGPEPVYVSAVDVDRVELSDSPVELPARAVENLTTLPFIKVLD